ncbi:MAG: hypothetical protein ACFE95_00510 [Candidatus Hodarchaeota archaeon]
MKNSNSIKLAILEETDLFIKAFINYWEIVKKNIYSKGKNTKWQEWLDIAKNLLYSTTQSFYDNWKHTGMLSWVEAYISGFYSIALKLKGELILIPKQLIFFESCNPDNTLLSSLKKNPTKKNLERILLLLFKEQNIHLRKTDLKILQKLTQPHFSKSLEKYPNNKELAYAIRCDIRTISRSISYLWQHQMLSAIYLVDMARIGYQTMLLLHDRESAKTPDSIHPYIVSTFPLTFQDRFFTVVQYPYRDTSTYTKLMNYFDTNDSVFLRNQHRGWNFGSLTQESSDRWKLRPPLMVDGESWNKKVIIGERGVNFNLDPCFDPYILSYREGQLLGLVHKHSIIIEEYLSKQLKVSRSYILEDLKNLMRNRLIFRFPQFRNIGLGSWIYFYIRGFDSLQEELFNIIQHLKFFPYVNIMYNLKSGTLVSRMNLPPSWVSDFVYKLASLPDFYPDCSYFYYIGPKAYWPWGFDILNTFDWNNLQQE